LPQPTANDARASAMSARAKSLRIVCTFTSSHAATPGIRREWSCSFFSIFKLGTQKKTPLCGKRCRAGSVLAHCVVIAARACEPAKGTHPPSKANRRLGMNPPLVNPYLPSPGGPRK
jgi:hypothetical protein